MRITSVRTVVVGNPWKNWVYVLLDTSEGITGLGEATAGLMTKPVVSAVEELAHLCLGKDPRDVHQLWDDLYKATFLTHSPAQLHAMAGIEFACWDITGKSLGVPVWRLLGGRVRDRVRIYANGWYTGPRTPEGFAQRAREVVAMGYTALKFDPFGSAYLRLTLEEERLARAMVEAVREAVGNDVDIMIEAHDRFSVSQAIKIAEWLAPVRPLWLEAPVLSTDVEALVSVARRSPVPIAAGERFVSPTQFSKLLAHQCIDILQPEPLNLGGIWRTLEVAAIAQAHHASLALHNAESPVKTVIAAHICAVVPNILVQECFDQFLEPWVQELFQGMVRVEGGYMHIPDRPGLGIELNEGEARKHPYSPRNFLRLFQAGWEHRRQAQS